MCSVVQASSVAKAMAGKERLRCLGLAMCDGAWLVAVECHFRGLGVERETDLTCFTFDFWRRIAVTLLFLDKFDVESAAPMLSSPIGQLHHPDVRNAFIRSIAAIRAKMLERNLTLALEEGHSKPIFQIGTLRI